MNLKEKIQFDLKDAMKSGDKLRLETIRSIRALILEFEKSGLNKELTLEEEIKMLGAAAKKRKASIEQFKNAGRIDLADKEEKELKIIEEYLPIQLSRDEVLNEIKNLAGTIDAKTKDDFSGLMPLAAKNLKGRADGKLIKEIIELFLGNS